MERFIINLELEKADKLILDAEIFINEMKNEYIPKSQKNLLEIEDIKKIRRKVDEFSEGFRKQDKIIMGLYEDSKDRQERCNLIMKSIKMLPSRSMLRDLATEIYFNLNLNLSNSVLN